MGEGDGITSFVVVPFLYKQAGVGGGGQSRMCGQVWRGKRDGVTWCLCCASRRVWRGWRVLDTYGEAGGGKELGSRLQHLPLVL